MAWSERHVIEHEVRESKVCGFGGNGHVALLELRHIREARHVPHGCGCVDGRLLVGAVGVDGARHVVVLLHHFTDDVIRRMVGNVMVFGVVEIAEAVDQSWNKTRRASLVTYKRVIVTNVSRMRRYSYRCIVNYSKVFAECTREGPVVVLKSDQLVQQSANLCIL